MRVWIKTSGFADGKIHFGTVNQRGQISAGRKINKHDRRDAMAWLAERGYAKIASLQVVLYLVTEKEAKYHAFQPETWVAMETYRLEVQPVLIDTTFKENTR